MEVKISNYKFTNQLIGILDQDYCFLDLIKNLNFDSKVITINGKKLTSYQKRKFLQRLKVIDKKIDSDYLSLTVYQYMRHQILNNCLELKDYRKKIMDSLSIVGLKSLNLNKKVIDLSNCEKKLLQFATALLSNPDILIFDAFLENFDMKLRKKIYNLFVQLVEKYQKIVILCSNKSEILYKYTKQIIIIKDNKKLIEGSIDEVFSKNVRMLTDEGIDIPEIVLFSYKANTIKNAKLNYHKDPRDLIKDIYKKV